MKPFSDTRNFGFGLMRLPMRGDEVDIPMFTQMADEFLEAGFCYFDTAYPYIDGKSEAAVKTVLSDRYPRGRFRLATKLPGFFARNREDCERFFATQLERTGAGYFDYYLLHAMDVTRIDSYEKAGCWDLLREKKDAGLVKFAGFSFHDKAEVLDRILQAHPWVDFVQLQVNYADWDDPVNQSRLCLETARRHEKPVIVMEPVKGGSLLKVNPEIRALFTDADPNVSLASWAIRFAASQAGVAMVLSGMSDLPMLRDNLKTMSDFKPLTQDEYKVVWKAVDSLGKLNMVPCTGCRYCVADCPQGVLIPYAFSALNLHRVYNNLEAARDQYGRDTMMGGKASACIECGQCQSVCPQHIEIIQTLKECVGVFE